MTTINTNVSSLIGQRILNQNNKGLSQSLERLSTGLKINRGADGPAGLIASEKLRSDKASISAAIGNAERADQVINVAEGGLNEVQSMLTELQGLVSESANDTGLSTEEKEANQFQVDQILQTIDRISSTTSFGDTKLLNGSQDFQVTGVAGSVTDYQINAAKFETGSTVAVQAVVNTSAQHAGLFVSTGDLSLTNATDVFSIELGGAKGTREFSFATSATAASMATSINQFKSVTGVSAAVVSGGLMIKSTEYGSDQFVSFDITNLAGQAGTVYTLSAEDENNVKVATTAFAAVTAPVRDEGQDVGGVINGQIARGKGLSLSVSSDGLDMEMSLTAAAATDASAGTISAMSVSGGGATFNIGPEINVSNQIRIGMQSVASRNIGNSTDGYLDSLKSGGTNSLLSDNLDDAQKIVNNAIDQISKMRGRLGSVQSNVIGSTINSLNIAYENTSAAESAIRDTDFAEETASLTRNQILVSAATNVVAMSNARPQSVLGLLG
jgi:flagellin